MSGSNSARLATLSRSGIPSREEQRWRRLADSGGTTTSNVRRLPRLEQIGACFAGKRLPLDVVRTLNRDFDTQIVNLIDKPLKGSGRNQEHEVELDDIRLQRAHQRKINRAPSKAAQGDAIAALSVGGDCPCEVIDILQAISIEFEGDLLRGESARAENLLESEAMVSRHAHHVAPVNLEQ